MDKYKELIKKLREKQYYSLLSVEEVVFNDKEFYQSLAVYEATCQLLEEKPHDLTLEQIGELK